MRKVILDTNVLLNDPKAIFKFGEDDQIILPVVVIQEIDRQKKRNDSVGNSARQIARDLDDLRSVGPLHQGVRLPNGGTLRVLTEISEPKFRIVGKVEGDHYILQTALDISETGQTVLVTEDTNLRILADALGVTASRYENMAVKDISFYDDVREVLVSAEVCRGLSDDSWIAEDLSELGVYQNEYLTVRGPTGQSFLVMYVDGELHKIDHSTVYSVTSKNREQAFALDALMDPSIHLVCLAGKAGSGKTLLSLAAGLQQSTEKDSEYEKMTICRPVVPLGKELGFLPGSLEEKLSPWMGAIHDQLEYLFRGAKKQKDLGSNKLAELQMFGKIDVQAIQFMRGRTLPNQFILVDEAQNTTPHEIATIITRVGKNSKIVLTGDPYQIDSPYLDQHNNGLSHVINRFRGQKRFAHVTLNRGERSELAELAAQLLT